jgi:nitrite reductase/ring-hydroxylating ferredoxin subunit
MSVSNVTVLPRPFRALRSTALGALALLVLGATVSAPASAVLVTGGDSIVGIGNVCLELGGVDSTAPGPVDGFACNGLQNQQWDITNGQFQRANNGQTLCLEVTNQATTAGSQVDIGACGSTASTPTQYWSMNASGEIVNAASGLCLDWGKAIKRNGNGTILTVQRCSGGFEEEFWLR